MVLVANQGGGTIRTAKIYMPDEKDLLLAEALEDLGIKRNVAKLITYLRTVSETTSRDIEIATELRQPEVSIGMKVLHEKGWIDVRELKKEGRGRPMKIYALRQTIDDIIRHYENQKLQDSAQIMQTIMKLKLLSSI